MTTTAPGTGGERTRAEARPRRRRAAASADQIFRAFADRTRLRILRLLAVGGEVCVCDLVDALRVPQPRASRHLAYLRRAGLVRVRKDGLWSHYRLAPAESPLHRRMLACLAQCLQGVPEVAADERRLRRGACAPGNAPGNAPGITPVYAPGITPGCAPADAPGQDGAAGGGCGSGASRGAGEAP